MTQAPLGPIRKYDHWIVRPDGPHGSEGWVLDATYWLDRAGNEYNSIGHVLRCAVAKELGL